MFCIISPSFKQGKQQKAKNTKTVVFAKFGNGILDVLLT